MQQYDIESELEELKWLIEHGNTLVKSVDCKFSKSYFRGFLNELERNLESTSLSPLSIAAPIKIKEIKYSLRTLLKQLSGLASSTDWQSPSRSNSMHSEKGHYQTEEDVYMRTGGSNYIKEFEKNFLSSYFSITEKNKRNTIGYATCSGMKALEIALIAAKVIRRSSSNVYYQKGFYFEGTSLVKYIFPDAVELDSDQVIEKIKEDEIGIMLLEPGSTWPFNSGINLDNIYDLLHNTNKSKPLIVIIDRTTTSITNQMLYKLDYSLPAHVVLIIVESAVKYYQFGMDLCNMGFIVTYGKIFRYKEYRDLIEQLMYVLSGIPDPSLIMRLPQPSRYMLEKRLSRIARNTELYVSFLRFIQNSYKINFIETSVDINGGCHIYKKSWRGSLIFVKFEGLSSSEEYYKLTEFSVTEADPLLNIHLGSSFGFDSLRVSVVEDLNDGKNAALRLSIGSDTLYEQLDRIQYLYYVLGGL